MRTSVLSIALACLLAPCRFAHPEEVAFNRGVEAYVAKDYASARAAWELSVAAGDHSAENNLGYLLYEALGGPRDRRRALELWKRAAEAGHSEAQWHLGQVYRDGYVVDQSNAQAFAWFSCALATAQLPGARLPEAEKIIAKDARNSLARLSSSMSRAERESAEPLAVQYIRTYARRSET